MPTNKELEKRIADLESLIRRAGIPMQAEVSDDPTQQPDYLEPGSEEHLAFLGLVRVDKDSPDAANFVTREGADGSLYRLVDPVGSYAGYADPKQAAWIALLQKVENFEAGPSVVHDKAPPMWIPEDVEPELARIMRGR